MCEKRLEPADDVVLENCPRRHVLQHQAVKLLEDLWVAIVNKVLKNFLVYHRPSQPIEHVVEGEIVLDYDGEDPEGLILRQDFDEPADDIVHALDVADDWVAPNECVKYAFDLLWVLGLLEKRFITESPIDVFINLRVVSVWLVRVVIGRQLLVVARLIVCQVSISTAHSEPVFASVARRNAIDHQLFEVLSLLITHTMAAAVEELGERILVNEMHRRRIVLIEILELMLDLLAIVLIKHFSL